MREFFIRTGYLIAVGLFFYATYGFSNWLSAQRINVPEIIFQWEYHIPFMAWTIIPYWSLNVLYALAFYLCRDRIALHQYILQLVAAQIIAVTAFLCFPLQFSWAKPETEGLLGQLFASLAAFDQPYNQAPSLHIILTVIVGAFYWRYLSPIWRLPLLVWLGLIALSILTTYQHHFIDLPTGALVGFLILWALPDDAPPPFSAHFTADKKRRKLAAYYLTGAILSVLIACAKGAWLWALWVSVALLLVAYAYGYAGEKVFQKNREGKLSVAAKVLLLPYLIGVRLNILFWLRAKPKCSAVNEKLYIGSITQTNQFASVVDLCAEYPRAGRASYAAVPMLDLVAPCPLKLATAATEIEHAVQQYPSVLVCCALGYGRSAAAVLTWLVAFGGCSSLEQAIEKLRAVRPQMVLSPAVRTAVESAMTELQKICQKYE